MQGAGGLTLTGASEYLTLTGPDVYDKTTMGTKLADKTEKSTTSNSATSWSSGFASDGCHYLTPVAVL